MEFLGVVIAIAFIAVIVSLMSRSRSSNSGGGQPSPGPGPEPIEPTLPVEIKKLSRAQLEKLTKAELVEEGAKHGVQLKQSSKKSDLVDAVNKAQKQK